MITRRSEQFQSSNPTKNGTKPISIQRRNDNETSTKTDCTVNLKSGNDLSPKPLWNRSPPTQTAKMSFQINSPTNKPIVNSPTNKLTVNRSGHPPSARGGSSFSNRRGSFGRSKGGSASSDRLSSSSGGSQDWSPDIVTGSKVKVTVVPGSKVRSGLVTGQGISLDGRQVQRSKLKVDQDLTQQDNPSSVGSKVKGIQEMMDKGKASAANRKVNGALGLNVAKKQGVVSSGTKKVNPVVTKGRSQVKGGSDSDKITEGNRYIKTNNETKTDQVAAQDATITNQRAKCETGSGTVNRSNSVRNRVATMNNQIRHMSNSVKPAIRSGKNNFNTTYTRNGNANTNTVPRRNIDVNKNYPESDNSESQPRKIETRPRTSPQDSLINTSPLHISEIDGYINNASRVSEDNQKVRLSVSESMSRISSEKNRKTINNRNNNNNNRNNNNGVVSTDTVGGKMLDNNTDLFYMEGDGDNNMDHVSHPRRNHTVDHANNTLDYTLDHVRNNPNNPDHTRNPSDHPKTHLDYQRYEHNSQKTRQTINKSEVDKQCAINRQSLQSDFDSELEQDEYNAVGNDVLSDFDSELERDASNFITHDYGSHYDYENDHDAYNGDIDNTFHEDIESQYSEFSETRISSQIGSQNGSQNGSRIGSQVGSPPTESPYTGSRQTGSIRSSFTEESYLSSADESLLSSNVEDRDFRMSTSNFETRDGSVSPDEDDVNTSFGKLFVRTSLKRRKFVNPDQPGYVGFANLPNQVHRKSVKKGFEFTLMVVGDSGLGKSTLVDSLFRTDLYPERHIHSASERIEQTVSIDTSSVEIEEQGVKLRLTVVDTPGFGDALQSLECFAPIIDYIDEQFERYLEDECGLNRRHIIDNRVHCCFYFVNPSGHGLKPLDVAFMKAVHNKVNIIPVVAKADTLTKKEVVTLKRKIMDMIEDNGIQIYPLPDCDSDEDEDYKEQCRLLKAAVPFAVVGSNMVIEVKGRKVRGRMYPWGVIEVENPEHCDFIKLRTMLITHMQDLQEVTQQVHYENFRARKMADSKGRPAKPSKPRVDHNDKELTDKEKQLKEKDAELQRMQEMLAKMQAQVEASKHNGVASHAV